VVAQDDQEKYVPAGLDGGVGDGEDQPFPAERAGSRGGQDQAAEQGGHDQQLQRRPLRVQPVGDPDGDQPDSPQGHQHDQVLEGAAPVQVPGQGMGKLKKREDKRRIEEQLQKGPLHGALRAEQQRLP
jgi:hypothetical protein